MSQNEPKGAAIVTGAAQGIGLGIARALARAGFAVALADINADMAERSAAALRGGGHAASAHTLDVADADGWARVVAEVVSRWGGLNLLVNSAGISPRGTAETTDEALWERTLAINLKGPWLGTRAALPELRRSRGAIVNIGTTRATRPMPGLFSYICSKAGLLGLTQQVAVEYLAEGITCNMVAPGWVDTPGERVIQARHGRPDFPDGVANLIEPDEIGDAVVFLTTAAGRRMTGTILYLDAGLHVADDAGMVYLPDVQRLRYHTPEARP